MQIVFAKFSYSFEVDDEHWEDAPEQECGTIKRARFIAIDYTELNRRLEAEATAGEI